MFNLSTSVRLLESGQSRMREDIATLERRLEKSEEKVSEFEGKINELWRSMDANNKDIKHIGESVSLQKQMVRDVYEYVLRQQGKRVP